MKLTRSIETLPIKLKQLYFCFIIFHLIYYYHFKKTKFSIYTSWISEGHDSTNNLNSQTLTNTYRINFAGRNKRN